MTLDAASCRVVLVEPENPRNVGFAARAMKAFGVRELAVVGRDWPPVPVEAKSTGVSAIDVLEEARSFPDLAAALKGCASAVAFSRRPTTLRQKELLLPDAPPDLPRGKTALVFGRESNGLTKDELSLCPVVARIPSHHGLSLNLGQAVAVGLYALTAGPAPKSKDARKERPAVTVDQLVGLWDFLEPRLRANHRFTSGRLQRIRQMFYRMKLDDEDFDLLFSVLHELAK